MTKSVKKKAAPQKKKPVAKAPTNETLGSCVDVQCNGKRRVTYILHATSSSNLSIPIAVAINGKVDPAHLNKPGRISGANGKISIMVDSGSTVSLYLNSDAHPHYRKTPVYSVDATQNDVVVTITEKSGPIASTATLAQPTKKEEIDTKTGIKKTVEYYNALLTGKIWMDISHKYDVSEVDALLPSDIKPDIKEAVKRIYAPENTPTLRQDPPILEIELNSKDGATAKKVKIKFVDSENPKANIPQGEYRFLEQGLTRVHPSGYAALFTAAVENEIDKLVVTSAWRPMLGSIAHRAGLGLDVNYVGDVKMNRQELRDNKAAHTDNVSEAEKKLFKEYEDAEVSQVKADTALKIATANNIKYQNDPIKGPVAVEEFKKATKVASESHEKTKKSKEAWEKERDRNEPATVRAFRTSLLKCSCVKQLFDPWLMENDTHDKIAPQSNLQRGKKDSNERLHSHHLHITVNEPKIL